MQAEGGSQSEIHSRLVSGYGWEVLRRKGASLWFNRFWRWPNGTEWSREAQRLVKDLAHWWNLCHCRSFGKGHLKSLKFVTLLKWQLLQKKNAVHEIMLDLDLNFCKASARLVLKMLAKGHENKKNGLFSWKSLPLPRRRKLKLKLNYDRQSVDQSVLVSGSHLGPVTNFSFSLKFSLDKLRVCYFVAPSLTRGRVCNLLLLLVLNRAVPLGSESLGTQDHILLSQVLRLPQP
jgi:hypothetical protein